MPILKNWYITKYFSNNYVVMANIHNDYRFQEGALIHTSAVKKIEVEGDVCLIHTRNTVYSCDINDFNHEQSVLTLTEIYGLKGQDLLVVE